MAFLASSRTEQIRAATIILRLLVVAAPQAQSRSKPVTSFQLQCPVRRRLFHLSCHTRSESFLLSEETDARLQRCWGDEIARKQATLSDLDRSTIDPKCSGRSN